MGHTLRAVRDDAIYACNQRDEIFRFAELPLLLPLFYAPASVAGATDTVDYDTKLRAAAAVYIIIFAVSSQFSRVTVTSVLPIKMLGFTPGAVHLAFPDASTVLKPSEYYQYQHPCTIAALSTVPVVTAPAPWCICRR
jgi:hypothetical protein